MPDLENFYLVYSRAVINLKLISLITLIEHKHIKQSLFLLEEVTVDILSFASKCLHTL